MAGRLAARQADIGWRRQRTPPPVRRHNDGLTTYKGRQFIGSGTLERTWERGCFSSLFVGGSGAAEAKLFRISRLYIEEV